MTWILLDLNQTPHMFSIFEEIDNFFSLVLTVLDYQRKLGSKDYNLNLGRWSSGLKLISDLTTQMTLGQRLYRLLLLCIWQVTPNLMDYDSDGDKMNSTIWCTKFQIFHFLTTLRITIQNLTYRNREVKWTTRKFSKILWGDWGSWPNAAPLDDYK